jgi:hypothetical protein
VPNGSGSALIVTNETKPKRTFNVTHDAKRRQHWVSLISSVGNDTKNDTYLVILIKYSFLSFYLPKKSNDDDRVISQMPIDLPLREVYKPNCQRHNLPPSGK